ncbi:MAG: DsbA family protein [Campylobacteraceae bacterium]|jgi:protein-disulfide isomerase|nr:DsbA family protein [Campylobacteraceae bacterium]
MKPTSLIAIVLVLLLAIFGGGVYAYNTYSKNKVAKESYSRLVRDYSFISGAKDAKVTVVEFFDPACPACVQISPVVEKLPDRYPAQVRVVYRALALPSHKGSEVVLSLLEAAKEQGKYKEALSLFNSRYMSWYANNQLNVFIAWGILEQAGVDGVKAKEFLDANQAQIDERLRQNMEDSAQLNVQGTPTFFVNDKQVKTSELIKEIEAAIAEAYK